MAINKLPTTPILPPKVEGDGSLFSKALRQIHNQLATTINRILDETVGAVSTITVGSTTTGNAGTNASVENSGTAKDAVLDFTIPRGANGTDGSAATVAVGTVSTGAAGSNATVVNAGTSAAAVLNFTIPRGDTGATGAAGADGNGGGIVCIGDSITSGYPFWPSTTVSPSRTEDIYSYVAYLRDRTGLSLINKGIGGQTTTNIWNRFTTDVLNNDPKICIIMGGLNDPGNNISLATTQSNFTSMVGACRDNNIVPIIIITTPNRYLAGMSEAWHQAVESIRSWLYSYTSTNNIATIDGYSAVNGTSSYFQPNDLHLTESGYARLGEVAMQTVQTYTYILPTASTSVLGGVKVGSGLSISSGVLSATGTTTPADWQTWTPTISATSGTLGTCTVNQAYYYTIGKITFWQLYFDMVDNGTGSGIIRCTLPVTPSSKLFSASGRESGNGLGSTLSIGLWQGYMYIYKYDGSYIGRSGNVFTLSGFYEAQ